MSKRPRSVTVISWIFIAVGCIALLISFLPKPPDTEQQLAAFRSAHPVQYALMFVGPILAIISGIFMLLGCNWARWLLVVWFGQNVVLGLLRSPLSLLLPTLLFAVAVYFLFRPQAMAYFRGTGTGHSHIPKSDETPA